MILKHGVDVLYQNWWYLNLIRHSYKWWTGAHYDSSGMLLGICLPIFWTHDRHTRLQSRYADKNHLSMSEEAKRACFRFPWTRQLSLSVFWERGQVRVHWNIWGRSTRSLIELQAMYVRTAWEFLASLWLEIHRFLYFDSVYRSTYFDKERIRPYSVECTRSRSISEVKQPQAGLVLGWVTAWEYPVLYPFALFQDIKTRSGQQPANMSGLNYSKWVRARSQYWVQWLYTRLQFVWDI